MGAVMIEIRNLTKKYNKKYVLRNLSLTIEGSQIVGLLGQNGSGKTTLIKIIAGMIQDYEGSIKINGEELSPSSKAYINYLPSEPSLDESWTVDKTINYYQDMFPGFDGSRARHMIEKFKINLNDKIKTLSSGMKEKVEISLVMSRKSDIYLLDEPLGGVDVSIRKTILENIIKNYSEGALLIISTHLINDIESIIDRAIILKDEEVYEDILVDDLREKFNESLEEHFIRIFEEEYDVF